MTSGVTKTGQSMKVTIVTTMRNEGRHLLEWVAYHRAIGVTDFVVFTNDCEDGTDELLKLLPDVTHIALEPGDKPPQWRALRQAWDHPAVQSADWISCVDCDEFININNSLNGIFDLIEAVEADAIMLPWRLFGHSDHIGFPDAPTTDAFTKAAPVDMLYPAIGSYFKTLFRREGAFRQLGVHRPKQKNPDRHGVPVWVDGSGQKLPERLAANDGQIMNWGGRIANELVQLNHYSVRSVSDFMVKRSRGLPNHQEKQIDLTYWVERNFNAQSDETIRPRLSSRDEILINFRLIPGVVEVENNANAWARAKLEALLKDPDELALFGRLILASGSQAPDASLAMRLVRAYQVAHG